MRISSTHSTSAALRLSLLALAAGGVTAALGQTVITPDLKAPPGAYNASQQGFAVRTYETTAARGPGDSSSIENVEQQLAGGFGENVSTPGPLAGGRYRGEYIHYSLADGVALADPDWQLTPATPLKFPGIVGTENFSLELVTYLELPAGTSIIGIGSDDSFRMTIGIGDNPFDFFAPQPANGAFNGSRAYGTNTIMVQVTEAGVYPMRIVYGQGAGDGGLQVYTLVNLGSPEAPEFIPFLINDPFPAGYEGELRSFMPASLPITPSRAYVTRLSPLPGEQDAFPKPTLEVEIVDAGTTVETNSITMEFEGLAVTPAITQTGGTTYVTYEVPGLLAPLTEYTASLSFTDSAAQTTSRSWTFRTLDLLILPASYAYPADSGAARGFQGRVRVARASAGGFNASIATTDARLKDRILDTTLTPPAPFVNLVQTTSFPGPAPANPVNDDGTYSRNAPINYSMVQNGTTLVDNGFFNSGNGFPDSIYPGLPAANDATRSEWTNGRSTAWEEYTWLELPEGLVVLSIWHKDAGQIAVHANDPRDLFRESLVLFDTNAGNREDQKLVLVEQAGIYGFRVAQAVFDGDQSMEFYTSDPFDLSNRTLIGDAADPDSINAFETLSVATRPFIDEVRPAAKSSGAAVDVAIEVDLVNLEGETPIMKVNGNGVTYGTTTSGDMTTLRYTPAQPFGRAAEVTVELAYGNAVSTWNFFTTSGIKALVAGNEKLSIAERLAAVHKLDVTQLNEAEVPADASFLSQFSLIWNSEAVNSGNAGPYIRVARELPIPAINVESANAATGVDKFWYMLSGANNYDANESLVNITNASSALAGGLRNGTNVILLPGGSGTWHAAGPFPAIQSGEVFSIGTSVEGNAFPVIYLEKGTVMDFLGPDGATNWVQPARRIQFAIAGPGMIDQWNDNAWALFDQAVEWLLPQRVQLSIDTLPTGAITLGWTGGGELQESTNLSSWGRSANQANPQEVPASGQMKFYRIMQ